MRSVPRLGWLNGKQFPSSTGSRKNRPGEKYAHAKALAENQEFDIKKAAETDIPILAPKPEGL